MYNHIPSYDTLKRWAKSSDTQIRLAAIRICQNTQMPYDIIDNWLDDSYNVRMMGVIACSDREDIPEKMIEKIFYTRDAESDDLWECRKSKIPFHILKECVDIYDYKNVHEDYWSVENRVTVMHACENRKDIPISFIIGCLYDESVHVRQAAAEALAGRNVPTGNIEEWLRETNLESRIAAMNACRGRSELIDIILRGLRNESYIVREAAVGAYNSIESAINPDDIFKTFRFDDDDDYILALSLHDVNIGLIQRGLDKDDSRVRLAAAKACVGRKDIPSFVIRMAIRDSNWRVREAAVQASIDRDDLNDVIAQGLSDYSSNVRRLSIGGCRAKGIPITFNRVIDPPKFVYKKCLNDVIVVASIPDNAQIRGGYERKYRADKAKIVKILGNVLGEPVGISSYDTGTIYYAGDEVEIKNFDVGDINCSTGFHFFLTKEEAERYNYRLGNAAIRIKQKSN